VAKEVQQEAEEELAKANEVLTTKQEAVQQLEKEKERVNVEKREIEQYQKNIDYYLKDSYTPEYRKPALKARINELEDKIEEKNDQIITVDAKKEIATQELNTQTYEVASISKRANEAATQVQRAEH